MSTLCTVYGGCSHLVLAAVRLITAALQLASNEYRQLSYHYYTVR
jgi:hypothetical protein